ncbi:hypothetical protein FAK_02180 [Desulfoferula mesophila]|uniref:Uncharacterized protein n=1 Tax=Desulfoferula mesophila TaxID=3058419 RepID=A0AAU9EZY3_9BACT|nr:hypothetical protein FAK_02180 [Desulfoferula mesophilus]
MLILSQELVLNNLTRSDISYQVLMILWIIDINLAYPLTLACLIDLGYV